MVLFTRKLRSGFRCLQYLLAKRRTHPALWNVPGNKIRSLMTMLALLTLLGGCHRERNPVADVLVGPPLPVAVVETPVPQVPPVSSVDRVPSVDQGNEECGPEDTLFPLQEGLSVNRDWFRVEKEQAPDRNPRFIQPNFSCPLWKNDRSEWTFSGSISETPSPSSAGLTDRELPSPDDLWNVGFATTYHSLLENGWNDGVSISVESISEKPFSSLRQMTEAVRAFLEIPQGSHTFWLWSLSYSSSNDWSLPIPRVECNWQPSGRVQTKIGVILPITDHPLDAASLDVSVKLFSPLEP